MQQQSQPFSSGRGASGIGASDAVFGSGLGGGLGGGGGPVGGPVGDGPGGRPGGALGDGQDAGGVWNVSTAVDKGGKLSASFEALRAQRGL